MHDCLDVAGHTIRCVTSTCTFRFASLLMSCPWIYLFPFRCDAKIINLLVSCTIETGPRTKQIISWLIKWMELYKSFLSSFTLFSPQTCIRISLEIPEREERWQKCIEIKYFSATFVLKSLGAAVYCSTNLWYSFVYCSRRLLPMKSYLARREIFEEDVAKSRVSEKSSCEINFWAKR